MNFKDYHYIDFLEKYLKQKFPYFAGVVNSQAKEFGDDWLNLFNKELSYFFGDEYNRFEKAIDGYGRFSLDGMRLQKKFDKTRQYENKTYLEAADEVYQNREYMFSLYLPGIFLSHYLWFHHYKQHIFYMEKFLPLVKKHGGQRFYDIGVGTGFYSKEMLSHNPNFTGEAFDLSPFSIEHTCILLEKWGVRDRYSTNLRDIVKEPVKEMVPFFVNIEVLEHLEDPQSFLNALYQMLEVDGYGLISAAITAPNADHIYLYNEAKEVIEQIENAGFKLVDYIEDPGYTPRKLTDSVPRNAAFIVTK